MATSTTQRPLANGTNHKSMQPRAHETKKTTPNASKNVARKPAVPATRAQQLRPGANLVRDKAASVAGENPATGATSAYAIMASRIANRVAEMAENITFVERSKPQEPAPITPEEATRRPRKLEMRLQNSGVDAIAFSAPFLDNTLQKMLQLQNRMLQSTAELSKTKGLDEKVAKEHAAQSAELSRIIALICAEKARQGA